MTWLSLLLCVKIFATTLLVAVPFLFAPQVLLEKFSGIKARNSLFFRLYGVAVAALLVGYGFGIPAAEGGHFPWGVACMGTVSNAGASVLLFTHARSSAANCLALFFGVIALGLVLAMGMPSGALNKVF